MIIMQSTGAVRHLLMEEHEEIKSLKSLGLRMILLVGKLNQSQQICLNCCVSRKIGLKSDWTF